MTRISPVILLVIVILSVFFFVFGLLQLLIRCSTKRPTFSSISHSNRFPDALNSHAFQRQLQQLFRLHDAGLDQSLIDALPVFYYREIVGLKEPFDCSVCLCEFCNGDKLKLLPGCSHAFHMHCIETWLLSNSSCPLCRTLITPEILAKTQSETSNLGDEEDCGGPVERWPEAVFSVRLGKFRIPKGGLWDEKDEVSCSNLDGRRCYSMGAFQYIVVGDSELRVVLADRDGRKIGGDSFSVSKIWLWPKNGKFSDSGVSKNSLGV